MRSFYISLLIYNTIFSVLEANEIKDPWKGDEYAHNSNSQKESAERFISALHLQNISSVLDIGCGDGKITAAIAKAIPNGQVVGIDISPSMIHFAEKTFSDYSNLKFFVQDAAHMEIGQTFDLITSFTVMQWVLEQKIALEGFHKALNPGGRLCIQMPTGLPSAMTIALDNLLSSEKWKNYFTEFSPPWRFYQLEEYRTVVNQSNFTIDRLDTNTKHEKFPSKTVFHGFLKQWFPYLRPIPSHLKDLFLTELLDLYLQILPIDENGQVSFIVTRLELEAHK